jgi:hypothetical protein
MKLANSLIAAALLLLAFASSAHAAPQWRLDSVSDTTVANADNPLTTTVKENEIEYFIQATNLGDQATDGSEVTLRVDLAPGMEVVSAFAYLQPANKLVPCFDAKDGLSSVVGASAIVCSIAEPASPFARALVWLPVRVPASASGTLVSSAEVSGGGAATVTAVDAVTVSDEPPPFGFDAFDTLARADAAGKPATQAGGHPYDYVTEVDFNTENHPDPSKGHVWPVELPKNVLAALPPGFVGNTTVLDTCTSEQLAGLGGTGGTTLCPATSQVGVTTVRLKPAELGSSADGPYAIYSMIPPPGVPARFGFNFHGTLVTFDAELRSSGDYGLTVGPRNIPPTIAVAGSNVTFWGVPSAAEHDHERSCPGQRRPGSGGPHCVSGRPDVPFLRLPTSCEAPGEGYETSIGMDSWQEPGDFVSRSMRSHEGLGYPHLPSEWGAEVGNTGCEDVPVKGKLSATPTSIDTETPTGLSVKVEIPNPGMDNPSGIASSDIEKVRVTLPQGVTINPSQAEGLNVCSPSEYESTVLSFFPTPGKGCPEDSKVGSVEVVTPLLHEHLHGDVYVARQDDPSTSQPGAENPFDSLLAIYVVIKSPDRGILVKLAGEVETDERTGQIVTTFEDLPQQPFDSFEFRFREGARAPLVTPPACGTYDTVAEFWGHSDPDGPPVVSTSSFEITRGIGGGACPPGGIPPFNPGFSAGSLNNNAASYSPFNMRLTRSDGEQDMTKFSSILPPGVVAKIAGVEKCPEAAVAAAKGKTGRQELAAPSCPANSQIGRSLAGAGVGSVLTYVPGKLYLAGPWEGAPLSVVAITPAVAGPFDVGAVVVRVALILDPVTAEVHADGDKSDPIPHILEGIPLKLRDLRVYVDRDKFTLNPTSCDPSEVKATLFGSYLDVFSPADDVPVDLASRYQAANCSALGFKPKLAIKLKGGTKRGDFPGLTAVLRPRKGDANLARTVVKLPKSAFLEQGHIRTICTRVQFAAEKCPKGAVYGRVTAFSPLLDEPLKGPAYLRSSNNQLPDLVFALRGIVDIEASARIDSVRGGIRATFPRLPDAPISKVVVRMQGGQKGLIVNSRNLCFARSRASLRLDGHNGKVKDSRPVVKAKCGKPRKTKRR